MVYIWMASTVLLLPRTGEAAYDLGVSLLPSDIIVTFPLAVEMVLRFRTSVRDGKQMSEDPAYVRRAYMSTWFWTDLASLLPLRLFVPREQASVMVGVAQLRLLKLVRWPALFEASGRISMTRRYVNFHFAAVPLMLQGGFLLMLVHGLAIAWSRVYTISDLNYTASMFVTMYYISGVGYGIYEQGVNNPTYAMWFSCVCCLAAMLINGIIIGSIVSVMQQGDVEGVRQEKLLQTQAVLQFFNVPSALEEEILQFQNHVLEHDILKSYGSLIEGLPPEIGATISIQHRTSVLRWIPVIAGVHDCVKVSLAQHLKEVVVCPEDYIVVSGEPAVDILFINFGFVDVISCSGAYMKTLRPGSTFADPLVFAPTDGRAVVLHEVSTKCLGYVELLVLTAEDLGKVKEVFPRLAEDIKQAGAEEWERFCDVHGCERASGLKRHGSRPHPRLAPLVLPGRGSQPGVFVLLSSDAAEVPDDVAEAIASACMPARETSTTGQSEVHSGSSRADHRGVMPPGTCTIGGSVDVRRPTAGLEVTSSEASVSPPLHVLADTSPRHFLVTVPQQQNDAALSVQSPSLVSESAEERNGERTYSHALLSGIVSAQGDRVEPFQHATGGRSLAEEVEGGTSLLAPFVHWSGGNSQSFSLASRSITLAAGRRSATRSPAQADLDPDGGPRVSDLVDRLQREVAAIRYLAAHAMTLLDGATGGREASSCTSDV
jgi:hypothetical protein